MSRTVRGMGIWRWMRQEQFLSSDLTFQSRREIHRLSSNNVGNTWQTNVRLLQKHPVQPKVVHSAKTSRTWGSSWRRSLFCRLDGLIWTDIQLSRSVVSDSLPPHESQHARPPCPSPTPGVHSNSCPSSRWCHPAISSSVVPFSSCPQSLPASESFPMSQLFAWGGQRTGVSALASFLPKNTQDWSPLEWTGWISLQSLDISNLNHLGTFTKPQLKAFTSELCVSCLI